jgi:aspartate/methionine/tyrosine aminotransferase
MKSSHLAKRVLDVTPSVTVSLPDKARELKRKGIPVMDLSEGQPQFDTPAPIKEAAKAAIDAGFVFYVQSAGLPELREEIKKKLLRDNEIDVPISRIMVTVGAKQAIFTAMLCTIDDGDEVLIPDPYWGSHASMVEVAGGHPVSVHMKHEKRFAIDTEELEKSVTSKTKMVVLSSPHNPTGMVVGKDSLESIADICRRQNILALADEIYGKLVYDGVRHYSLGSMPGMDDLTITVNGFSKEYSMTGWRLGYVAAPKEIFDKMLVVQQHSVTHPTAFVQKAGVVALRDCGEQVKEMVHYYKKARDYFVPELNKLSYFECEIPQGAFYAFPRIIKPSMTSAGLCDRMLDEAKVLGVPGSAFGKYGEGHVRFVYAQEMETLNKAIESLKMVR